jgi:S-DNA-T family DNA segregation ATPase FtsK/SpoIIIE
MARKGTKHKEPKGSSATKTSHISLIKNERTGFIIGLICVFFTVYLSLAFVSYFFTGAADQSILEHPLEGELEATANPIHNYAGVMGAKLSAYFIDGCFGIPALLIPLFLGVTGLRLMKAYKMRIWKWFLLCSLLMIWTSIFLGFLFERLYPATFGEPFNCFFHPGGLHGHNVSAWIASQVGNLGLALILIIVAILFCLYLSSKTMDVIRKTVHPEFKFRSAEKAAKEGDVEEAEVEEEAAATAESNEPTAETTDNEEPYEDEQPLTGDLNEDFPTGEGAAQKPTDKGGETPFSVKEGGEDEEIVIDDLNEGEAAEASSSSNTEAGAAGAGAMGAGAGIAGASAGTAGAGTIGTAAAGAAGTAGAATGNVGATDETGAGTAGNAEAQAGTAGTEAATTAGNPSSVALAGSNPGDPGITVTIGGTPEDEKIEVPLEPYNPKLDLENYRAPGISLLKLYEDNRPAINREEQTANKNRIIEVLRSFGVEISSISATVGPTITLYEITPAQGVRIAKIRNLENDIALTLAAEGIRIIAPIPGKGTIGIEVPNAQKKIVPMRDIVASRKFQESTMELPLALGKTITNEVFMVDLAKAPHMLVAGATGMGKSVGLNAIVTSLLYKKHPAELKFVIIDPKKVEFAIYAPIEKHFLAKLPDNEDAIITDVNQVKDTLNSLCKEMDTRYALLKDAGCRNIKEYNEKFKARMLNPNKGHHFMPYIVIIIDEFGDLIMTAGKEVELPICRIAQLARAVGIHAIIATQRPTTNIITGTIKANFPARVAFRVAAAIDSKTILDRTGAQQLIGKGDMLYLQGSDPVRVQCAFVDTPEVERIAEYISKQQGYTSAFELPEPDAPEGSEGGGAADVDMKHLDPMFEDAARLIVMNQQGSTSLIQRKFAIGYNRAGRLMDQLERAGIVGPQIGSKPREVLCISDMDLDMKLQNLRNN